MKFEQHNTSTTYIYNMHYWLGIGIYTFATNFEFSLNNFWIQTVLKIYIVRRYILKCTFYSLETILYVWYNANQLLLIYSIIFNSKWYVVYIGTLYLL